MNQNTAQHTPGPWRDRSEDGQTIVNQSNQVIAKLMDSQMNRETRTANARLIAAAPELLEASTAILKQWDKFDETGPVPSDALMEKLRAAIAKATGGNQP